MRPSCDGSGSPSGGRRATPREPVHSVLRSARGTALAALLAVALDLARELLLALHDRVLHVRRGRAGAQRDALEVERRLRDVAIGDRRVALLAQLDLELGQLGDLALDRAKALLDVLPQAVGDRGVPSLDRDAHMRPLCASDGVDLVWKKILTRDRRRANGRVPTVLFRSGRPFYRGSVRQ